MKTLWLWHRDIISANTHYVFLTVEITLITVTKLKVYGVLKSFFALRSFDKNSFDFTILQFYRRRNAELSRQNSFSTTMFFETILFLLQSAKCRRYRCHFLFYLKFFPHKVTRFPEMRIKWQLWKLAKEILRT